MSKDADRPSLPIASRNTQVQMPIPRARHGLRVWGVKRSKVTILAFPVAYSAINPDFADQLAFYDGAVIAVYTVGVVYFNCEPGAQQRAVNDAFAANAPRMRVDAQQFDFIVGQVLTKAGLPLTRREG